LEPAINATFGARKRLLQHDGGEEKRVRERVKRTLIKKTSKNHHKTANIRQRHNKIRLLD
jgi:hypothetical protein